MKKSSTTIKDIAKKLNVHFTTVSRALRNHPDVNPETRAAVLKIARELNYQPNIFATSLRNQKSRTIGVIVPEISHDFFSSIVSEIANQASHSGYAVMICQSNENYDQEVQNVSVLMAHRVAGLIACKSQFTTTSEHFQRIFQAGIPMVFFDRVCDDCNVSKVVLDFYDGAFRVVEHLIRSGYRRIAHIAGPIHLSGVSARLDGYKAALRHYEMPIDEKLIVFGGFLPEDGIIGASKLLSLEQRPDAIFAVDDQVALGAMLRIKEENFHIPAEIGVAGFDNDRIGIYIDPALTTVDIKRDQIGQAAIKLLLAQIQSKTDRPVPPTVEKIPTELIIRASSQR